MRYYLISIAFMAMLADSAMLNALHKEPQTQCYRLGHHSARVECVTRWDGDIIRRQVWINLTQLREEAHDTSK